jgi:CBS domain-containing protein
MTVAAVLRQKGTAVISVSPEADVAQVAHLISSRRIGAVVVLGAEGELLGIVSERDVVRALSTHGAAVLGLRAADLMTRNVITATHETTVDRAMEIMDQGYFRHLPVLHDRKLAGIISIRDLVKYRMMLQEHEVESMKAYVTRNA